MHALTTVILSKKPPPPHHPPPPPQGNVRHELESRYPQASTLDVARKITPIKSTIKCAHTGPLRHVTMSLYEAASAGEVYDKRCVHRGNVCVCVYALAYGCKQWSGHHDTIANV